MTNLLKPRNPVARSPLLRKGGVHEKNATAKRQHTRTKLNQQLYDWQDDLAFEREQQNILNQKELVKDVSFSKTNLLIFRNIFFHLSPIWVGTKVVQVSL